MGVRALITTGLIAAGLAACTPGGGGTSASADDAEAALAALGLTESDRISWQDRSLDGAQVRFDGFTLSDEDGTLVAEQLIVRRPRL
jgi:hypothetical protein